MTTVLVVALASLGCTVGILAFESAPEEAPNAQQPFWSSEPAASNLAVVQLAPSSWQSAPSAR